MRVALTVALLLALVRPAAAQSDAENEGRALFKEATRLVDAGDYVSALAKYQAAYARYPNAKILLNIGTMLSLVGRNAEAADTFEKYLADPNADAKRKPEVKRQLAEVERRIGSLRITIEGSAAVRLDGKPLAQSAGETTVRVDPGFHTVIAEYAGAEPIVKTVEVKAGEVQTLRFAAPSAKPAEPPPPAPSLTLQPAPAPPTVSVVATRTESSAGPPRWTPWAALAASLVAVGAGSYFGTRALDQSASFGDRSSAATNANIAFISGGVLALGSAGLWLWRAKEHQP